MSVSIALRPGVSFAWLAAVAAVYVASPGHRAVMMGGLPLGAPGTALIAALVVLGIAFRRIRLPRQAFIACAGLMVLLLVARVVVGSLSTPGGWRASYFSNEDWAGPPQWSSDFRTLDATRIDRQIAFSDDTFPAHYLNDYTFNYGDRREVTEPMSVEWRAYARLDAPRAIRAALRARGTATMTVDGRSALTTSAATEPRSVETAMTLASGTHEFVVRYRKPADTDGLIVVQTIVADDAAGAPAALTLTPWPADRRGSDRLIPIARVLDAAALLLVAAASVSAVRQLWRSGASAGAQWLTLALGAWFGAQGWWQAIPFAGRVRSLTAGDDWWGFEACARDILHHGPLMTLGRPIGQAEPYFYHPFYSYFLAAVHGVTGESLFGPVFVQFLILAAVAAILWRFTADLFGRLPAFAGVAALVIVFELDFTRYYTVTLLTENLYVLTVALTIPPLVRWIRSGERADLIRFGCWGGISTMTRPPMLLYLFPALALIALVDMQRSRRVGAAIASVAVAAAAWAAAVAPTALRNIVVAHRFVLVSEVARSSIVKYNLPPSVDPAAYDERAGGTFTAALGVLARVGRDHPRALLGLEATKIGFSLGMVHWAGGYRPHPELIAVTGLYLAMCVVSARMRSRLLWPVHLFVLVHLASMLLTMPWNYGYRLILPPFVYTTMVSTAAFTAWVTVWRPRVGGGSPLAARA